MFCNLHEKPSRWRTKDGRCLRCLVNASEPQVISYHVFLLKKKQQLQKLEAAVLEAVQAWADGEDAEESNDSESFGDM